MYQVTINSRGRAFPSRVSKTQGDRVPVVFDFSLLLAQITAFEVKGDMPVDSSSLSGSRVTVNTGAGQECRTYDLTVSATDGNETREVTIQVKVEDRERGWADGCACGGYY